MDLSTAAIAAIQILFQEPLKESAKRLGGDLYEKLKKVIYTKFDDEGLTGVLHKAEKEASEINAKKATQRLCSEMESDPQFASDVKSIILEFKNRDVQIQHSSSGTVNIKTTIEGSDLSQNQGTINFGNMS
jgi:hypothetical protein